MVFFLREMKIILIELRPIELNHFGSFLRCRIWSLCNQILLQFSMDVSQLCRYIVDILEMCM